MLYLHIPFCQSRCIYCDFFSTASPGGADSRYVKALCHELAFRQHYLPAPSGEAATLHTIYFGGGTPSLLPDVALEEVMRTIRQLFRVADDAEVTLECNPDDVCAERVAQWRRMGVNRVSLGIQTFSDSLLRLLRRRHTAAEAERAVRTLAAGGIDNLSIDLIYGLPRQNAADFREDLQRAFDLPVKHLSSYALSVEEGTVLGQKVKSGELVPANEDTCVEEYNALLAAAEEAGFVHYEISNFALPGFHSRHNSGYWNGTPYLGVGPGAHSFDGECRRHNLPLLAEYLGCEEGDVPHTLERLDRTELINEMIFTSLRTRQGLDMELLAERFGQEVKDETLRLARPHLAAGKLELQEGRLRLTKQGILVSDDIMSDLMQLA